MHTLVESSEGDRGQLLPGREGRWDGRCWVSAVSEAVPETVSDARISVHDGPDEKAYVTSDITFLSNFHRKHCSGKRKFLN